MRPTETKLVEFDPDKIEIERACKMFDSKRSVKK